MSKICSGTSSKSSSLRSSAPLVPVCTGKPLLASQCTIKPTHRRLLGAAEHALTGHANFDLHAPIHGGYDWHNEPVLPFASLQGASQHSTDLQAPCVQPMPCMNPTESCHLARVARPAATLGAGRSHADGGVAPRLLRVTAVIALGQRPPNSEQH